MSDLWEQFCHLHPDMVKSAEGTFTDPDFAAAEAELIAETEGVIWDDTVVVPYEADAVFVSAEPAPAADEWVDVDTEE